MIEVSQNIIDVTVVAEQDGISVELQPVLVRDAGGGAGVGTLQEVLDTGNTALAIPIDLTANNSDVVLLKNDTVLGNNIVGSIITTSTGAWFKSINNGNGGDTIYRHGQIEFGGQNFIPETTGIAYFNALNSQLFDASTNNLGLANTGFSGTRKGGTRHVVSVAGTVDFGAGNITFGVGDIVANDGTVWFKEVDNNQGGVTPEVATYSATSTAITTLDCDTFDSRYQILTANTDIQWTNTPASGESFVKNLEVVSTTTESLAFSTATKVIGSYDVGEINLITVNFANYPTVGLRITVLITQ